LLQAANSLKSMREKWNNPWLKWLLIVGILIFINIIAAYIHGSLDLTEDKRYTLTPATKKMVASFDEIVYVKVLLDGEFPAGFIRLRNETREVLNQLKAINPRIQFEFENPVQGTSEEILKSRETLEKDGIIGTTLKYYDGTQMVQKTIYPYAVINIGSKKAVVNLLEEQTPGIDEEVILNNSVALLEYKFTNTFQKLLLNQRQRIFFTTGQGELDPPYTYRLERELRKYYTTNRVILDSVIQLDTSINLLIVAGPRKEIANKNLFKIDQYIMRGGKVVWLVEKLDASLDSIAKYGFYVPRDIVSNTDNILFKYGARIQPNLILDLDCSAIPQVVGMSGDKPQTMMFPWNYHLALSSKNNHKIVKNIDRVNMFFPSSIDTLPVKGVKKTILLSSSPYSRTQFNPVRLNFEVLKVQPDPSKYNDGNKAVAVLLEGKFESFFKNRVTADFAQTLAQLNASFKEESIPTQQIVISDIDFMQNLINPRNNKTEEIGFNKWEVKYYKGNKDFILNCIDFLLDADGVMDARSKEIKLRLLDQVKVKNEKGKWQAINLILPLCFLAIVGLVYNFWRRKKYTR
jgi:ABC-2 type transport system permease protein